MTGIRTRWRAWTQDRDQGSMTPMIAVIATALLLMVGLVYDGSLKLRAAREATSVAAEASRAAGQELTGDVIAGPRSNIDPGRGAQAARAYLRQVGASGPVTVSGDTITITTSTSWQPAFTGLFGAGDRTVTGTAQASTKRVLGGEEQ